MNEPKNRPLAHNYTCVVMFMAGYSELIKNFEKIRDFTRDFFIYGFRGRGDVRSVSKRSYDNERRRIESYLSGHIVKRQDSRGRTISITSNTTGKTTNPLFKVWETKSFTKRDCFLHFVILDILSMKPYLSVAEIADIISRDYTGEMDNGELVDMMTIRNKLNEYTRLGILKAKKDGKTFYYSLCKNSMDLLGSQTRECLYSALDFYKNILAGGFIGHTVNKKEDSPFIYRQIFFAHTLDDEVLLRILDAIKEKRRVMLNIARVKIGMGTKAYVIPLMVLSNTRTGRRYVGVYSMGKNRYSTIRIDSIKDVEDREVYPGYDSIKDEYKALMKNTFSIMNKASENLHSVKVLLYIDESTEQYVVSRIEREGRHGMLVRISENVFEYTIEVPDTLEMVPWLRTFIGRIINIEGTEEAVISRFKKDIKAMMSMYAEE